MNDDVRKPDARGGGCLVINPKMLEMVLDANERMKDFLPHQPEECPGHSHGPHSENLCRFCGIEVDDEETRTSSVKRLDSPRFDFLGKGLFALHASLHGAATRRLLRRYGPVSLA